MYHYSKTSLECGYLRSFILQSMTTRGMMALLGYFGPGGNDETAVRYTLRAREVAQLSKQTAAQRCNQSRLRTFQQEKSFRSEEKLSILLLRKRAQNRWKSSATVGGSLIVGKFVVFMLSQKREMLTISSSRRSILGILGMKKVRQDVRDELEIRDVRKLNRNC